YCPVCNKYSRKFWEYGVIKRKDALCFFCGSLERHRLVYIFLKTKTDLFSSNNKKMLHIAPEGSLGRMFQSHLGNSYLSADLNSPHVMVKMDIQDIKFDDCAFDIIFCSHVLEHVPDDIKAMKEFYRVLKCGGFAIIQVPVKLEHTYEDPSTTDQTERLEHFGQEDHVRKYGLDFTDRLKNAGFAVEVISASDLLNDIDIRRMGIRSEGDEIYYCTKK
ncbi:MAG: class I SAM-dependent methyltransferase, partial [Thermodesulfobacteriota bacterium]